MHKINNNLTQNVCIIYAHVFCIYGRLGQEARYSRGQAKSTVVDSCFGLLVFIFSLLTYLKDYNKKLIWVFWGQKARKIGEECQISTDYSLISAHPSPYSAERFFGSRPFSKVNKLLSEMGKEPVNWLPILQPTLEKSG